MQHIEQRPDWTCRACGEPWPCETARKDLAAELEPAALRIHMWLRLEVFAQDHPHGPAGDMFARFLRWAR